MMRIGARQVRLPETREDTRRFQIRGMPGGVFIVAGMIGEIAVTVFEGDFHPGVTLFMAALMTSIMGLVAFVSARATYLILHQAHLDLHVW
jgi:hypothetical protein